MNSHVMTLLRAALALLAVGTVGLLILIASVLVASMLAVVGQTDDAPGAILMGGGVLLIGIAFALLMAVMSGLLRTATGYRTELSEVV